MAFMNETCLLSICIPTYNRFDKLQLCLECITDAIKNYSGYIEIIISDNHSNDETANIIEHYKTKIPNLTSYRNEDNYGFNKNMLLLLNNYSRGKYIWMIGDDDYIDSNAISQIINIILDYKSNIILVKHRIFHNIENFVAFRRKNIGLPDVSKNDNVKFLAFSKAMDNIAVPSNIFCTFFSSVIFKKNMIKREYFNHIQDNHWDKFYNVFPNAYLIINSFHNEKNVCVINNILISVVEGKKNWDDKLDLIWLKHIPDLYNYIEELNIKSRDLRKSRYIIVKNNILLLRKIKHIKEFIVIKKIINNIIHILF